jgi:hypothetical protein
MQQYKRKCCAVVDVDRQKTPGLKINENKIRLKL